jgi:phytanoyl-CoA hydroxylase
MLSIDSTTKENGCIQFVPGSHKGELLEHDRARTSFGLFLPGFFEPRADTVAIETEPGDCTFFGPLVIHGSGANPSPSHRRANTFAYNATNNGSQQSREMLRGESLKIS